MKSLARWTMGPCSRIGFPCLRTSVSLFKKVYGDRFDQIICHNQLTAEQEAFVQAIGVPTLKQGPCKELPCEPRYSGWKFYPPRLRPEAHEIFLDTDILMIKPIAEIESFLMGNGVLYAEDVDRYFGRYDHRIAPGLQINAGVFGVPPGYDLGKKLRNVLAVDPIGGWHEEFDEQGMLASILSREKIRYVVPLTKLQICLEIFTPGCDGYHLVTLNKGQSMFWKKFLRWALL